ncbi:MAG: FGGY-family carbohydrate kinase [Eubacteriales bacterium]|nr:FGGY-family carbohydrate kinase [Eubacteriales bacterium]
MENRYYMGIDVGTNESKGVLIDENCRILCTETVSHAVENPKPNYYEQDAEAVWWGDFCKISRALLQKSGICPESVEAVGCSALSADVVPVDERCVPLRKAILYGIDARAVDEMRFITSYYGPERMESLFGGRPLCSSDCMPKILWIRNNEPEIFEKTYKFLTASSFLTAKLTGAYVIDRYLAASSFAPCYRGDLSIDASLTEELYCRADQLAQGRETAEVVGTVTGNAAAETGLAAGTKVVTGTDDSGAEAISTGVLQPGDLMIQLGSTCYIMYCSDRMIADERIWSEDYLIPGTFCQDGGTNTAGALTKWMRDVVFSDYLQDQQNGGENAFARMCKLAQDVPAGSDGLVVLPYFAGERTPVNDPLACGVYFGLLQSHTRSHLYRAALEGVAYSIAQHVDILEEHGMEIRNFLCVGGGAQNHPWLQIIADVTGHTVKTAKVTIGSSYGDAMIAAIGAGRFSGYADLAEYIESGSVFTPNMENHAAYKPYRSIYTRLYLATKPLMHELAARNGRGGTE